VHFIYQLFDQVADARPHGFHAAGIEGFNHQGAQARVVGWIQIQDAAAKTVNLPDRTINFCSWRWFFGEARVFQNVVYILEIRYPPELICFIKY
jgi:hypothetical protein